ncbi:MAG TPA: hypothetical protein DCY88_07890 [Cyanobacteria bacterium UBA11372]|nr:hypothetical protein [Cyanobacteria bacterium UBA11372]
MKRKLPQIPKNFMYVAPLDFAKTMYASYGVGVVEMSYYPTPYSPFLAPLYQVSKSFDKTIDSLLRNYDPSTELVTRCFVYANDPFAKGIDNLIKCELLRIETLQGVIFLVPKDFLHSQLMRL